MIISEDIKLRLKLPVTNEQVESAFSELGINVLRWAITEADGENFIIRAAIEK